MLNRETWVEIRQLYEQGLGISEISRRLNIDRKTVRKYAQESLLPKYKRARRENTLLEDYKNYLNKRLSEYDLSAKKLFNEIKHQGYSGSYSWLAQYIATIKKENNKKAVMRFETLPGEQAQVDWGYLGEIYDVEKRKIVKLHCFFIILGYSRMLYAEVFPDMKLEHFLKGHNHAFIYFGGYTREILYDNLKSVVIKRALSSSNSEFNKKFMDFAGYYGFKPILCRPYKPNTKGKIENSVNFVKKGFYQGNDFTSLKQINEELKIWLDEANKRDHATIHEAPISRLKKETLLPITNKNLYDLSPVFWRSVSKDCYFSYEANFYSVPYEFAGKEVTVHKKENMLNVFYRDLMVTEHQISLLKGEYVKQDEHFKGLKELRCSHSIKRPKKLKVLKIPKSLKPAIYENVPIMHHELSSYEQGI